MQPQQIGSWQTFADKVRAYAGDIARERARSMTTSAGTAIGGVQHIEHAVDVTRNRLTALEDVAAAAKALYSALSQEQRMLADSRIASIVEPRARSGAGPDGAAYPPDQRSYPPDAGANRKAR